MNGFRSLRAPAWLAAIGVSLALATSANAEPILASIDNASNYSLIHFGSNPAGTGDRDDWWRFDDGQDLSLDLSAGLLTLLGGTQSFSLSTVNGATGTFDITDLSMNLNDADGFLGGTMNYVLNGTTMGQFAFADANFGSSPFNSSSLVGSLFSLFAWGGDADNDLGIDFGISGTIPEPGTALLFLIGAAGFAAASRKKAITT